MPTQILYRNNMIITLFLYHIIVLLLLGVFKHIYGVLARPPLCKYKLNRARRTSWGWWDEWNDPAPQTQDSKFESWRSEAEHATSRSQRLPTILNIYERARKKYFVYLRVSNLYVILWKCFFFMCIVLLTIPANTRHWTNVGSMLVQCRRRWANIRPALVQRVVRYKLWWCTQQSWGLYSQTVVYDDNINSPHPSHSSLPNLTADKGSAR